jgi:hypothetical protein
MQSTTESIASPIHAYSNPITRWYRLQQREDKVLRADLPWEFVDSSKRANSQANRAFADDGPATALFANLISPFLYTLYGEQMGIAVKYRHARCIRSRKALEIWREELREYFRGCYLYKFEVGLDKYPDRNSLK